MRALAAHPHPPPPPPTPHTRTLRSADAAGYYDGCGQVTKHLDFKSVCSTDTPGIIVVTPSTDKAWVRAPWDTPITQIGADLLMHVARPREATEAAAAADSAAADSAAAAPPLQPVAAPAPPAAALAIPAGDAPHAVLLSFADDKANAAAPLLISSPERLQMFEFFGPMLSGRWKTAESLSREALSAPCGRALFTALLAAVETGDLPPLMEPTPALLVALRAVADELGLRSEAALALLPPASPAARLAYRADLYALSPTWWRVDAEEEDRMARRESSVAHLVRVDAKFATKLMYAPLKRPEVGLWLFQRQPSALSADNAGRPVLASEPAGTLAASLPRFVASLLRAHPEALVLAGGAVTGKAAQVPPEGADLDIFFHSVTPEAADAIVARTQAAAAAAGYAESRSGCALTYTPQKSAVGSERKPFQLILCLHRDRAQVLESFDLAPCKALARYEGREIVVEALPAWVESMRHMAFWVDTHAWSASSVARICKYIAKGFECAVPATRRAALAPRLAPVQSWMALYNMGGLSKECPDARRSIKAGDLSIASLFDAEAEHLYGTLGGGGGEHWTWPEEKPAPGASPRDWAKLKMNPHRLTAVDATTIAAALAGAPELGLDHSKLRAKVKESDITSGCELLLFSSCASTVSAAPSRPSPPPHYPLRFSLHTRNRRPGTVHVQILLGPR